MSWRAVKSLLVLRDQINAAHPSRSKGGDGLVGDLAHSKESASDHNPHLYDALGKTPVVCALDITHDPAHGCDSYAIAEAIRASRDPRVAYIISNRRIASNHAVGSSPAWAWRTYTGTADPHTGHMHVSTVHDARADQTQPWRITTATPVPAPTPTAGDDMTHVLIKTATSATVWLADGTRRRTVASEADLAAIKQVHNGSLLPALGNGGNVYVTGNLDAWGVPDQTPSVAGFTDAQVTAIADRLVASNANGLTATDHAAIVADVKAALDTAHLTTG